MPQPYLSSLQDIRNALLAQGRAMRAMRGRLEVTLACAENTYRILDEQQMTLKTIRRKLNDTIDLMEGFEEDGADVTLERMIEQLEQNTLDRSNGRFADKYRAVLERARAVRDDLADR